MTDAKRETNPSKIDVDPEAWDEAFRKIVGARSVLLAFVKREAEEERWGEKRRTTFNSISIALAIILTYNETAAADAKLCWSQRGWNDHTQEFMERVLHTLAGRGVLEESKQGVYFHWKLTDAGREYLE